MKLSTKIEILEADQQNLRNDFSKILGEFKILKWIAGSLWFPALAGLGVEVLHYMSR